MARGPSDKSWHQTSPSGASGLHSHDEPSPERRQTCSLLTVTTDHHSEESRPLLDQDAAGGLKDAVAYSRLKTQWDHGNRLPPACFLDSAS